MPRRQQNLATLRSEVFAPTFSAKTIYVYNSPDAGHDGLLKIGDASVKGLHSLDGVMPNAPELDAAAKKRIDSYTRTQGASYNLLRTELAVRKLREGSHEGFRDHHVHRVLKNSGVEQVQPNGSTAREWFKTDLATSTNAIAADKPVRHILALSGGKAASYVRALDMFGPILTKHYPKPIVGGLRGAVKVGDTSFKSQRKASELTVNCADRYSIEATC